MALDLRKVSHFIGVAEELNFTRAAARLHMSQQALSASIRQLERELGVTLLERSTRHVELTNAGRALLDDGRPLLAASAAARERTRRTGRGEIGELRAGRTPAVTGEEMAELARVLRAKRPEIGFSAPQVYPGRTRDEPARGASSMSVWRASWARRPGSRCRSSRASRCGLPWPPSIASPTVGRSS